MNKKFVDTIIINKAPEWVSDGCLLPVQHNISLHYQNSRPTLLSTFLNIWIFVLNLLLTISNSRGLGLSVETLRRILRIWVISSLQISFIRFSAVRKLIIYQSSLLLKTSSYLRSIVEIIFSLKHTSFKISRDSLPTRWFSTNKL